MPRFLIIRLSSIGDIVLTTPVIRCLKQQVPHAEVHVLTRASFRSVLQHNPYIDRLHLWDQSYLLLIDQLKQLAFDQVIDLHHNARAPVAAGADTSCVTFRWRRKSFFLHAFDSESCD